MPDLSIAVPDVPKTATQFINEVKLFSLSHRDEVARQYLLDGHVPSHMRSFVDVTQTFRSVDGNTHTLTLSVLPDVLCIGTDDDYVRIPLTPLTAQQICDAWGCMLPTTRMSDIIWHAAVNKLQPLPWGPPYDASMQSTDRVVVHNQRINDLIKKNGFDATKLSAGHKKDVVMTPRLVKKPKQVSIYGWHQLNGKPIQPLYLGHENTYEDYSHGLRMVSLSCILDGQPASVQDIMADANMCTAVTSEGANSTVSQPPGLSPTITVKKKHPDLILECTIRCYRDRVFFTKAPSY